MSTGEPRLETVGAQAILLGQGQAMISAHTLCPGCKAELSPARVRDGFTHPTDPKDPDFACPLCTHVFTPTFTVGYGPLARKFTWQCSCDTLSDWQVFWHETKSLTAFRESNTTILPHLLRNAPALAWNMVLNAPNCHHNIVDAMITGLEDDCPGCSDKIKNMRDDLTSTWHELRTGIDKLPLADIPAMAELLGANREGGVTIRDFSEFRTMVMEVPARTEACSCEAPTPPSSSSQQREKRVLPKRAATRKQPKRARKSDTA